MKAVLDTNIFVGALQRHDGVNRAVLKHAFLDDITPLMSEALYSEYQSLMGRGHLFEDSSFNAQASFLARAARGSRERGLAALEMLDARDGEPQSAHQTLHDSETGGFKHKDD